VAGLLPPHTAWPRHSQTGSVVGGASQPERTREWRMMVMGNEGVEGPPPARGRAAPGRGRRGPPVYLSTKPHQKATCGGRWTPTTGAAHPSAAGAWPHPPAGRRTCRGRPRAPASQTAASGLPARASRRRARRPRRTRRHRAGQRRLSPTAEPAGAGAALWVAERGVTRSRRGGESGGVTGGRRWTRTRHAVYRAFHLGSSQVALAAALIPGARTLPPSNNRKPSAWPPGIGFTPRGAPHACACGRLRLADMVRGAVQPGPPPYPAARPGPPGPPGAHASRPHPPCPSAV